MRITVIRRDSPENPRLNLYLDGAYRLTLPEEVVVRAGLSVGDEVDESQLRALSAEGADWAARDAALTLLNRRARTSSELRRRLIAKGHPVEAVEACLDQLSGAGLLDDDEYARAFVRDRLRSRPKGVAALTAELRGKGVDGARAEQAVRETLETESTSELELARKAARKFRIRPTEDAASARRRLYGFLSRRGFSQNAITRVLAERTASSEEEVLSQD